MYYPPTLRTRLSTIRQESRTFCQRLARNLAHFDLHPSVWHNTLYKGKPTPPYLRLSSELRQSILLLTITDNELLRCPRPNSTTLDLILVDKIFAADVRECMRLWDVREKELREVGRKRKGPMGEHLARLAEDLMRPVRNHVAFRVSSRSACAKREAKLRMRMMERRREVWEVWEVERRGRGWHYRGSGWVEGGGDEGEWYGEDLGQGEDVVEQEELSKVQRRKERLNRRQAEREILEMEKCAWMERSRRQWENQNPEKAKLAKLRATYSRALPLAAHNFEM